MTRLQKILLLILIVVIWLGCILLNIEFSFGFIGFFSLIILTLVAGIVTLLIGVVIRLAGRTSKTMLVGLSLIVFCLSEIFATQIVIGYQSRRTENIAETMIVALDDYLTDHDKYPDDLEALVPDYLPSIPNTAMGWSREVFHYHKEAADRFTLSYRYPYWMYCSFDSGSRNWLCDD